MLVAQRSLQLSHQRLAPFARQLRRSALAFERFPNQFGRCVPAHPKVTSALGCQS